MAEYRNREAAVDMVRHTAAAFGLSAQELCPDPWLRTNVEVPPDGEIVLGVVTGRGRNVIFDRAMELVSYDSATGEWMLEEWPEIEGLRVPLWMPLPEVPEDA